MQRGSVFRVMYRWEVEVRLFIMAVYKAKVVWVLFFRSRKHSASLSVGQCVEGKARS